MFHLITIILTIALSACTIIGAFAGHISPADSSIMTFLALSLPILLLLCAITSVYWIIRFRFWVWVPLIAILINWNYLNCIIQNPFRERAIPKTAETLKISTYNIGRFGKDSSGFNARRIAFFMGHTQIDVICFQEFAEFKELTADSLHRIFNIWEYSLIPQAEDGENILPLAVYSKYPILDSQLITFPYTPNSSMWFDIQVNEKVIRIFNCHLQTTGINQSKDNLDNVVYGYSNNDIIRAQQAQTISALIKESPYPVLVAGDFNTPPSSYSYRTVKCELKDGFRSAGYGYAYTYRYFKRLLRIDYILHSPELTAVDYYSPDLDYSSDHNPVIMEIEI